MEGWLLLADFVRQRYHVWRGNRSASCIVVIGGLIIELHEIRDPLFLSVLFGLVYVGQGHWVQGLACDKIKLIAVLSLERRKPVEQGIDFFEIARDTAHRVVMLADAVQRHAHVDAEALFEQGGHNPQDTIRQQRVGADGGPCFGQSFVDK